MTYDGFDVIHPGWPSGVDGPEPELVDDLADEGWIRVTRDDGRERHFNLVAKGKREVLARRRSARPSPGRVDLSWEALQPVLAATVEAFQAHGAPGYGVTPEAVATVRGASSDPADLPAVLNALQPKYLEGSTATGKNGLPLRYTPTTAALELTLGWPADRVGTG